MIKHLKINNFKSIKEMEMDCKRVNVFIGQPNSGKTNILEAISMLSENVAERLQDMIRFGLVSELFFDYEIDKPVEINVDEFEAKFSFLSHNKFGLRLINKSNPSDLLWEFATNLQGYLTNSAGNANILSILFYKFQNVQKFNPNQIDKLAPPFGENIPALLFSNSRLKKIISLFLKENGYRLTIKPAENEVLLTKEIGDELYSYSLNLVSETIRRIIFLMLAIESNKNATLLFDEPEAHTFPFYTKYIAERIALDTTNQYFLTTHNPYLLSSIISKTPTEDLSVGVVYMDNYETKVHIIQPDQYEELTDADVFYNLEHLTEA